MRKFFLLIFLLILTQCEGERKKTLNLWTMGFEGKKIEEMIKKFKKEYPEVKVKNQIIPWRGAHEKLVTSVAGGLPPDLAQLGTTWVAEFASRAPLETLEKWLGDSRIKRSDYFSASWKTGEFKGRIYSLPGYVDVRVLFYRTDLLESLGLPHPPRTWDELEEVSRKLALPEENRYALSLPLNDPFSVLIFLWQNGGRLFTSDFSASLFHRPENLESLRFYKGLFEKKYTPLGVLSDMDLFEAFRRGIYPMFISGPWMLQEIEERLPTLRGKWEVALLPRGKVNSSFVGGSNWVIFKSSKNKDFAWKFIEFMQRKENQVEWYRISKDLPSLRSAWDDPLLQGKRLIVFRKQLEKGNSPPPLPQWEEVNMLLALEIEKIIRGKLSPRRG